MEDVFIQLSCGTICDSYIWGMSACSNDLFKINIENGSIEYVCTFSRLQNRWNLFKLIIEFGKKLILIPGASQFIVVFDMVTKEISYFEYQFESSHWLKYSSYIIHNSDLYLFPVHEPHILKINLESKNLYTIKLPEFSGKTEHIRFGRSSIQRDNEVFIPCIDSNKILMLNLVQDKCRWIDIGLNVPIKCLTVIENSSFLLTVDNRIMQWDFKTNEIEDLFVGKKDYISIVGNENYIWLIPYGRDNFERYDLKTGEITQIEFPEYYSLNEKRINDRKSKIPINKDVVGGGDFFCIVSRFSNTLIKIDLRDHRIKHVKLGAAREVQSFMKIMALKDKNILTYEQAEFSISELYMLSSFNQIKDIDSISSAIGSKIHHNIIEEYEKG